MADARELSYRLGQNAQAVTEMLLPNGKREGHEWACGSVSGEKGRSLKVCLSGSKTGLWKDFATGESGDLIDLWKSVKGLSMVDALAEIRDYLGIRSDFKPVTFQKSYKRPEKPKCQAPQSDVLAYLTNERGLTAETIRVFQVGEQERSIIFPYKRDEALLMWKSIGIDRDNAGKKKVFASKDSEPCLFGWQALDPNASYVVLVEGEIDAMTVHQWGHPALSVPFGGGRGSKQQWIDAEFHNLDRFREIYLCMDNDPAGQEATREIVNRLGAHRCKIVDLGFKDANACLMAGNGKAYFDACLDVAQTIDPEELKSAADFQEQVTRLLNNSNDPGRRITLPWAKTHQELCLEPGQLTIWSGYNGHGKSEMLLHVICHRMAQGERACIASMEVPPAKLIGRHILPMLTTTAEPSEPYRAAAFEWLADRLWLFNLTGTAKAERLIEVFRYAHKRYGVLHFVVDSLLKVGLDEDGYNEQKRFVEQLCDFKNETGAHVHLVAHSRKRGDEGESYAPKKHDVRGAGAITDLADNVLSVFRNKPKEDALRENPADDEELTIKGRKHKAGDVRKWPDAYLHCYKQREDGNEPSFSLWFDRGSRQFLESPSSKPKRYVPFVGPPVIQLVRTTEEINHNAPKT
jgi:twinkle protein